MDCVSRECPLDWAPGPRVLGEGVVVLYLVLAMAVPVLLLGAVLVLERYERMVLEPVRPPMAAQAAAPESGELPEQRATVTAVLRPVADAPRPLSVAGLDLAG